jgi:tetratricopeptide (TPR) repeat protein
MTRLSAAVVAFFICSVAHAEEVDRLARSRAHFEAGRALYSLGNYRDALREFTSGYQLEPRPQFLLNLGQTYRKLDELERAEEMYRSFLTTAPPDAPERPEVTRLIGEVERGRAARAVAEPVAPRATPSVAIAAPAPSAPKQRSVWRRTWWLVPIGAAVLAGAAVGIYFAARPADQVGCSQAGLGCIAPKAP